MNKILLTISGSLFISFCLLAQGSPTIVWSVQAESSSVKSVSVTSDGNTILTSTRGTIKTWRTSDGGQIADLPVPAQNIVSAAISRNGNYYSAGYTVGVYPPSGESTVRDIITGNELFKISGCFTNFSESIVAGTGGGVYRYFKGMLISSGGVLYNNYNGGYPSDIDFSPEGSMLAISSSDNTIKLYDSQYGTLIRTFSGHTNDVSTIAFSPDGLLLASGAGGWDASGESTIKIWNVNTGELITTLEGHGAWVNSVVFSSDGSYLISSGRDGTYPEVNPKIKIWRTNDWNLHTYYNEGLASSVVSLNAVPGTDKFVFGNNNGELILAELPEIIPVELSSFTAEVADNKVFLEWITSSEINNAGFEIERSLHNHSFVKGGTQGDWEKIGFVEGFGTTSELKSYSFSDNKLSPGKYSYRLKQIDFDGSFEYSGIVETEIETPAIFSLSQNYPNPFNPATLIRYQLPVDSYVTLKVYDVLGKEVFTLVNEKKPAGKYEIEFRTFSLASGIYYYRLEAENFSDTKKLILIK